MSALSDLIKSTVSMRAVAERCGFEPNRGGYIACPFHPDRTPSLKIYDQPGRGYYCYGCQSGGSVIDFVMRLNDLSYAQAVVRLAADFGLTADNRPRPPDPQIAQKRREASERAAEYDAATVEYRRLWRAMRTYAPSQDDEEWDPRFVEAVKNIDKLERWLEESDDSGRRHNA